MKYLLDTHAIIWYLEDSPSLPPEVKEIIDKDKNRIYTLNGQELDVFE